MASIDAPPRLCSWKLNLMSSLLFSIARRILRPSAVTSGPQWSPMRIPGQQRRMCEPFKTLTSKDYNVVGRHLGMQSSYTCPLEILAGHKEGKLALDARTWAVRGSFAEVGRARAWLSRSRRAQPRQLRSRLPSHHTATPMSEQLGKLKEQLFMRYWLLVLANFTDWLCRLLLHCPRDQWQQQPVISDICRKYFQMSLISLSSSTAMHLDRMISKTGNPCSAFSSLASTRGFPAKEHLCHCWCFFGEYQATVS